MTTHDEIRKVLEDLVEECWYMMSGREGEKYIDQALTKIEALMKVDEERLYEIFYQKVTMITENGKWVFDKKQFQDAIHAIAEEMK